MAAIRHAAISQAGRSSSSGSKASLGEEKANRQGHPNPSNPSAYMVKGGQPAMMRVRQLLDSCRVAG